MKKLDIKPIVILVAGSVSLFALIAQLIIFFNPELPVLYLALFFIVIFIISILIVNYSIKKLVINRIKPLYKLIQMANLTDAETKRKLKSSDPIVAFTKDFGDWANERRTELRKLTEMEKYRKEFLGNVSHELKTPLFNIQGYIFTLLDGGLEDDSINRKYLERTEKSIDRLISIVKDLESITNIESGNFKLQKENFDIIAVVNDVFEMQELRAKERGVRLQLDIKPGQQIMLNADKKRITQVLTNLIVNAINYGKENGEVKISFSEYDQNYLIEVNDNGIGIAEEQLSRIFERFYRVDKSRSRDQGGTGLGLAIVKHIIEAHEQTIYVRSKVDEGTSIGFTLSKAKK